MREVKQPRQILSSSQEPRVAAGSLGRGHSSKTPPRNCWKFAVCLGADGPRHPAKGVLNIAACKALGNGKEKLKTCFRQRERKREGKRRVMFESFPSKGH